MIPLKDENPTEITPFVTMLVIGLNVVVWFLVQGAGSEPMLRASVAHFGTYPCELTGVCSAHAWSTGWASLLTSMFMHGGWEHIIGNMLFLWVFGNNIEDSMGHLRFVVFYLVCGLAAGLAHVALSPASDLPTVGASGAISGIMGAYIVLYPRAKVRTWVPPIFIWNLPAWVLLGWWFVVQLLGGLSATGNPGESGGVAVWAHVGGFVAGVALIHLFRDRTLVRAKRAGVVLPPDEVARHEW
ncbi:MAG TPA: rhomboid family intramembrane serine protease [Longimicrobiaceae bacterium]|nr:rhomboid family intramembrane serine protease [Longimicrobiaceae bacterium]